MSMRELHLPTLVDKAERNGKLTATEVIEARRFISESEGHEFAKRNAEQSVWALLTRN